MSGKKTLKQSKLNKARRKKFLKSLDYALSQSKAIMIIGLIILFYGFSLFWVGYHNVDLCRNERVIACEFDLDLYELSSDHTVWGLDECYVQGLSQVLLGFYWAVAGAFFMGLDFLSHVREQHKKQ